jgi:hypothetical protein
MGLSSKCKAPGLIPSTTHKQKVGKYFEHTLQPRFPSKDDLADKPWSNPDNGGVFGNRNK